MANTILVGAQWGDEGKGKIIDVLTSKADVIVRSQGGNNAGHTIVHGGATYILHLIPSGILRRGKVCVIGNGVVVDPIALVAEIGQLRGLGVKIGKNLLVSNCAHLVMPYHRLLDEQRELRKGRANRSAGFRFDAADLVRKETASEDPREQQHSPGARGKADQLSRSPRGLSRRRRKVAAVCHKHGRLSASRA